MNELNLIQAVNKCKELSEITGKVWYFKANKGTVKLVCEDNNDSNV